jgi:hypothetical protein
VSVRCVIPGGDDVRCWMLMLTLQRQEQEAADRQREVHQIKAVNDIRCSCSSCSARNRRWLAVSVRCIDPGGDDV